MPIARWPTIYRLMAASVALLAASCAEIGDPELGAIPGDEPVIEASPGVTVGVDSEPTESIEAEPVFVPERPDGYVPDLIVTTPTGTGLLGPDGIASLGEGISAKTMDRAFDDLFGGLVVQTDTGEVIWFTGGSPAGQVLPEIAGLLVDVGFSGGAAEAIIATSDRTFDRYGLVDAERVQIGALAEGEAIRDIAAGGGLYLVALADGKCGQLRFLNAEGAQVSLGEPELDECALDGADTFTSVAITPTGDSYAYTRVQYRSDGVEESTEVVVADAATGDSVSIPVGASEQHVASLTFDGNRIAFLRRGLESTEVVIIDIARPDEPEVRAFEVISGVSFARLPLLVIG